MLKLGIIGAGFSGLSLAILLKDLMEVTLFEKGHRPSGRILSFDSDTCSFDLGAQYFTARTKVFQDFIRPLVDLGTIKRWNAKHVRIQNGVLIERKNWMDDEPRYVGCPRMNCVAEYLSQDLNIQTSSSISSLNKLDKWQLLEENGTIHGDFDWVVSTLPAPSAKNLLPESFKYHSTLSSVPMRPCFSLMLGFENDRCIEFEAAHVLNAEISWIAVNSHKPERKGLYTLMVHSSMEFAEKYKAVSKSEIIQHMIHETSQVLGQDLSSAAYKDLYKWQYANNAQKENTPILIDSDLQLAACGDWCLGGRVEGAFTSAWNLSNSIQEILYGTINEQTK